MPVIPSAALAGVGLATLFVAWVLGFVMPGIRVFTWLILALGAALVGVAVVLDFRRVKRALSSRRGIFGVSATVSLALVVGSVLLANAISVHNYHRFDFTGLSQFTLTTQTRQVLAELEEPVEVITFFNPADPRLQGWRDYGHDLLEEYRIHTDLVAVRQEDPELRPDLARQYRVTAAGASIGTVVFSGSSGQRQVYGPQIGVAAEHAFTSAILEVTGTRQRIVYFLTGHGESSVSGDYASAKDGLRDNLFHVAELDLLVAGGVPEDAAAVVIAGPRQALAADELALLDAYLEQGGSALILVNPDPQPELRELLLKWWLDLSDGVIVDPASHVVPNVDNPLVSRNRNTYQLTEIYFPGATAILPVPGPPEDVQVVALAWTTRDGWQERQPLSDADPEFDPEVDAPGPLALGVLVARVAANGDGADSIAAGSPRLVVIGDSDFASNSHFRNGNNSDLFLTLVNWLAQGEEIISVDRKVLPVRRLVLSPEEARILNLSSAGLLPLLLVIAGGVVWWRSR